MSMDQGKATGSPTAEIVTPEQKPPRFFVSMYTDGPATRWNVIDRQTQEWIRRFTTEEEAQAYIVGWYDGAIKGLNDARLIIADR